MTFDHSSDRGFDRSRSDGPVGPLDPFFGDPDDPAGLLDAIEPAPPLSDDERADVRADLADLTEFREVLDPVGVHGIIVECADCGEQHYFGWDLMAANLHALLGEGRTHVHEPAFAPDPDSFVSWDYARGYADAITAGTKRG
ncbi:MAG: DUF5319 domain-containing protein [Jatrophihabitantaceae bacterium]